MSTTLTRSPVILPPCARRDPDWWETGHPRNADAILLCETACPLLDTCKPADGEQVAGFIRAGVAYGNDSRSTEPGVPRKPTRLADKPTLAPLPNPGPPHAHAELVIQMLTSPDWPFTPADVAYVLGCSQGAVKSFWRRRRGGADVHRVPCPVCRRPTGFIARNRLALHHPPGDRSRWCSGRRIATSVPA